MFGFLQIPQIRGLLTEVGEIWHLKLDDNELTNKLTLFSRVKRFLELFRADQTYREFIISSPHEYIDSLGFEAQALRPLWDEEYFVPIDLLHTTFPLAKSYIYNGFDQFSKRIKSKSRDQILLSNNARYLTWRSRNMNRLQSQVPIDLSESIYHGPLCFELSDGCSVGCWFCGLSASNLREVFEYDQNKDDWNAILQVFVATLGSNACDPLCYSATDPFDNPDYEDFCLDVFRETGTFPRTTTALAHLSTARTRRLLELSLPRGCFGNRFSILSLKHLKALHTAFTPEELAFVQLIPQNRESTTIRSVAGRAMRNTSFMRSLESAEPSTIFCITGFKVNMLSRTIQLVSPCPASANRPDGYIEFEKAHFQGHEDLLRVVKKMIATHMHPCLRLDKIYKLRPDVDIEIIHNGLKFTTSHLEYEFKGESDLRNIGFALSKGENTILEILSEYSTLPYEKSEVHEIMNRIFQQGLLDQYDSLGSSSVL